MNIDSSSYYRANPYKDIGYMPPIALKNRRNPDFKGQIPQGQQHFWPTAKKHYDFSYTGQIDQDSVMRRSDVMSPLQRQAMQKSYFRSLNSKDIEGASTNTLISKAVKNKQRAQQQLQRRKQIQRQGAAELMSQYQQQQYRKKYSEYQQMVSIKPHSQEINYSNYHNSSKQKSQTGDIIDKVTNNPIDEKKKRQIQLLKLAQQRKNYAIVDFSGLMGGNKLNNVRQNSNSFSNPTNFHQIQLQRKRLAEKEKEEQQRKVEQYNQPESERVNHISNNNYEINQPNQSTYKQQPKYPQQKLQLGYNKNLFDQNPQYNQRGQRSYSNSYDYNQNYDYQNYSIEPITNKTSQQPKPYLKGKTEEINPTPNKNNVDRGYNNAYNTLQDQRGFKRREERNIIAHDYVDNPQVKNSIRKYNPTFLSFESSPFTLASKNLIGF